MSDAREKLTRDWGPQLQPDGLVLLRQIVTVGTKKTLEMAALTPSALKKLQDEGWIEIMFVDAGMEPMPDIDYSVRLADGQVKCGKTNKVNLWIFALATGGGLASVKAGSGLYQDALPNCCCHLDFEKTYPKRANTQLRSSP